MKFINKKILFFILLISGSLIKPAAAPAIAPRENAQELKNTMALQLLHNLNILGYGIAINKFGEIWQEAIKSDDDSDKGLAITQLLATIAHRIHDIIDADKAFALNATTKLLNPEDAAEEYKEKIEKVSPRTIDYLLLGATNFINNKENNDQLSSFTREISIDTLARLNKIWTDFKTSKENTVSPINAYINN